MNRRAAFTFTEIMLAVFILGMALLPIIQILSRTTGMSREERTQAAAAGFAGKLMNQYLYELIWSNLNSASIDGTGYLDDEPKTGVFFEWDGDMFDAWPTGQPMNVSRTKYHNGCGGACSFGIEPLPKSTPQEINPAFCGRVGMIFKTVVIRLKWRGPGETAFKDTNKALLVVRRGMLEEANQ